MDWKRFFDGLGMDGTRWQWRIYQWEQKLGSWRAGRAARADEPAPRQFKFCGQCGAMLERAETECPRCGARASSWISWRIKRMVGRFLPAACPVAALILLVNLIDYGTVGVLFGLKNLLTPESEVLLRMGALVPPLVGEGQWWRIITYGYLHIGLLHIAFNMIALLQVGPVLEAQVGGARFFVTYTLALIGGALADMALRGSQVIVIAGASGALFGLIGFGMSYAHFYGGAEGRRQRDFFLRWAVYAFLFGFMVRADNIAHFGGFLTGVILGFIVEREGVRRERWGWAWKGLAGLLALSTVVAFAAAALLK